MAKEKSSSLQTNDVAGYKENVIDNEITTKPQAPKINKQHILQEIDENRDIGMASGTILQNYEVKTNETKAQPGGLLRSMEGDDTKINKSGNVSGSISVK